MSKDTQPKETNSRPDVEQDAKSIKLGYFERENAYLQAKMKSLESLLKDHMAALLNTAPGMMGVERSCEDLPPQTIKILTKQLKNAEQERDLMSAQLLLT